MNKIKNFIVLGLTTLLATLLIFVFVVTSVTLFELIPWKKLFFGFLPIAEQGIEYGVIALFVFFVLCFISFFSFYFVKKNWFVGISNSVVRGYVWIIILTLAFTVLITVFIPEVQIWGKPATRQIILTLAALGALYGLIIAARRLNLNQKGFFNDTFSRGAELLGHEEQYISV